MPCERARLTQRSAIWMYQPLALCVLAGCSEGQAMSIRTAWTPAAASLVAIARRFASDWFHVQWNCTPTYGRREASRDPGAACAEKTAPAASAAIRGTTRRTGGRVAGLQAGALSRSGGLCH